MWGCGKNIKLTRLCSEGGNEEILKNMDFCYSLCTKHSHPAAMPKIPLR